MSNKSTAATVKECLTAGDRERFEHWASDDGEYPKAVERIGSGYRLSQTTGYWLAWHQCSTKSPAIAVIDSQSAEIERLREVAVMATDALNNYERMGEVCSFEGQPMIYAETLVEIAEAARAALSGEPK